MNNQKLTIGQSNRMYHHNKRTKKNTTLHTQRAKGARITTL